MKKGSLTIELSLLMPLIMGMFVFIIYSGFIMHDKCIADKACFSAALRGGEEQDDDEAIKRAEEAISEVLPSGLIAVWDYDTSIDIGEDMVRVSFTGSTEAGRGIIGHLTGERTVVHNCKCDGYRLNEAEYIRENKTE